MTTASAGAGVRPAGGGAAARLVVLCAREPGATAGAALRAAAAGGVDWETVLALASHHRVAAFVADALARAGVVLPPPAAQGLRQAVVQQVAVVALHQGTLRTALDALAAVAVPAIVLKGPVLARTIYPAARLRPYSDVDLSIRDAEVPAAAAALCAAGFVETDYEAETARTAHAGHVAGGAAFHRVFVQPPLGTVVELHGDPLQLGLLPADEDGRWARARPVPGIDGALMLGPEDQLVQLAVHALKHGFERLIWLKDLDLLVRVYGPSLDWALVATTARREGVQAAVWYGLRLARDLLAAPVTEDVLARFRPAPPLCAAYVLVWPERRIAALGGFLRRRAVQFHAAESWRGMLPSLVLMGRRRARLRAMWQALFCG